MSVLADKTGRWLPGHLITPNMAISAEALQCEALHIAKSGPSSPDAELTVKDLVNYAAVVHQVDSIILKMMQG